MKRASLGCLLLALVSCDGDPSGPPTDVAAAEAPQVTWALERSFGRGTPAELIVRVERERLDLSQDLIVEEELRLEPGFVGDLPEVLPDDLSGLGLARVQDLPSEGSDGRTIKRRRLHLEPERTGEVALNQRWAFFRRAEQDPQQESPLATERIALQVDPVPADLDLSLPPSPSLATEESLPTPERSWLPLAGGATLLLLFGIAALRWWRRARIAPPPPPPHRLALDALARLDALDLLGKGQREEFFVYLSAILREYVERRFGLRAPERTTQEFLSEVRAEPELVVHRALLAEFLEQADAVKFAREAPPLEVAQEARQVVERFVHATHIVVAPPTLAEVA